MMMRAGCGVVLVVFSPHWNTNMSMTRLPPSKMGVDRLGGGQTDLEKFVLFLALVVVIAMRAQWGRIHPINTVRCWRDESDQL